MPNAMPAAHVLEREFFEIRARILDLAASLDRLERGEGSVSEDVRMQRILEGLRILLQSKGSRAEQLQLLFSRAYDESWLQKFERS